MCYNKKRTLLKICSESLKKKNCNSKLKSIVLWKSHLVFLETVNLQNAVVICASKFLGHSLLVWRKKNKVIDIEWRAWQNSLQRVLIFKKIIQFVTKSFWEWKNAKFCHFFGQILFFGKYWMFVMSKTKVINNETAC